MRINGFLWINVDKQGLSTYKKLKMWITWQEGKSCDCGKPAILRYNP